MGSPPLRFVALLAAVAIAGVTAVSARADDQAARRVATSFMDALVRGDGKTACSLFTPETLQRLGGAERCNRMFAPSPEADDYRVMWILQEAFVAAQKSAVKRRGQFVTKKFRAKALARDMERLHEALTVHLGHDPSAAVGQLSTTVVLDTRSTARRVVLYAESDDGSIYRLSGTMLGDPDMREVWQGTPEVKPQEPEGRTWYELGETTFRGDSRAWMNVTWLYQDEEDLYRYELVLVLARVGDAYLVHDVFYSLASESDEG